MAITKSNTQLANAVTLTAGAGDVTSSVVDMTGAYGGVINVKITNSGSQPTIVAQTQVQVSEDNSKWYNWGPALLGLGSASAIASWTVTVDPAIQYVRCVSGSNTGQNVTLDIDCSRITAV